MFRNESKTTRPIMVLVYADSAFAARCTRLFRRLGWEVHLAGNVREAQRLIDLHDPKVAILDVEVFHLDQLNTRCRRILVDASEVGHLASEDSISRDVGDHTLIEFVQHEFSRI